VEELKASRARKLRARAKYEEYVARRGAEQGGGSGSAGAAGAAAAAGTDYAQWDLWCPSDDEDELFSGLTPSNPGFRAMEQDVNARHARCAPGRSGG
jgi:hypothetical protein